MKTAVITGAANGLGRALTEYLTEKGWKVFALDYNVEQLATFKHAHIIPVQVDVTDDESVSIAVKNINEQTQELDAIINFAGILLLGSGVEVPAKEVMRIMNVNLMGTYRINQGLFKLLLTKKGRIINISSETGILSPAPFSAFYYMSKRAIEVYSDALRRELRFLGIKVIKVRPGAFATNMQGNAMKQLQQTLDNSELFKRQIEKGNGLAKHGSGNPKNPKVLAQKIEQILNAKNPRIAYNININKTLKILSVLPERLQDFIYYTVLK
mgnify:CR=1 FL=1